jgi:transcriptional regulator with XRE-family HTH domain
MNAMPYPTNSIAIANKLRQVREELGFTQQQIADMLKRPQSYVSRCEKGIKRLDIEDLHAFCQIYNKPLSFFIGE